MPLTGEQGRIDGPTEASRSGLVAANILTPTFRGSSMETNLGAVGVVPIASSHRGHVHLRTGDRGRDDETRPVPAA